MDKNQTTSVTVGDIANSTVGAIGTARDVTLHSNAVETTSLDNETKQLLVDAIAKINTLDLDQVDKEDAADGVRRIAVELENDAPSNARIIRWWNRVKEIAPTVAATLSSVAAIAKFLTGK